MPQNLRGTIVETFSQLGSKTRYPRIWGALAYGHLVRRMSSKGTSAKGLFTLYP